MTESDYSALVAQLKTITNAPSDYGNRRGYAKARALIMGSELSDQEKELVRRELHRGADTNNGYHYNSNGIAEAIAAIESLSESTNDALEVPAFNLRNLSALVSDGRVFGVEFIKRSTGELRKISCRIGVKKHLKGGAKAYSSQEKRLLTVFDMSANGYRSIPVEGIRCVSVGGQSFNFVEVA